MDHFVNVKFSEAYDLSNFVWSIFYEGDPPEEALALLDPSDPEVSRRMISPQRDTILHLFLRRIYKAAYIDEFEQTRDDMLDIVIDEYETILHFNEIPFTQFNLPDETHPDFDKVALNRISYLRELLPLAKIAQDTFQLLFRDRTFLLRFNQTISQQLGHYHPINRTTTPLWLRRGVFYRDNGRCTNCGKNLTGSDFTCESFHLDHIIPLAIFGSNDPTNFQTLCEQCNEQKGTKVFTSERYPSFWNIE